MHTNFDRETLQSTQTTRQRGRKFGKSLKMSTSAFAYC
jgi:hypothetical protein